MKKISFIFITLTIIVLSAWGYYYIRWKHLWEMERPIPMYRVEKSIDDTIRVLLVGDSWAAMHSNMDSFLCSKIKAKVSTPVVVSSKGKGGEKSRVKLMLCTTFFVFYLFLFPKITIFAEFWK